MPASTTAFVSSLELLSTSTSSHETPVGGRTCSRLCNARSRSLARLYVQRMTERFMGSLPGRLLCGYLLMPLLPTRIRRQLERVSLWSMQFRPSVDMHSVRSGPPTASLLAAGDVVLSRD